MAVRIIYESIFSSAKIVQPYLHLRQRARIEDDAITDNPQAKLAIQSVCKVLSGHYGVAPAAPATLLASLLTIVASGLYAAEEVQTIRNVQIHRADVFNTSSREYPIYNAKSNLLGGVKVTSGVAYLNWTYDELALSRLNTKTLLDVAQDVYLNDADVGGNSSTTSPSANDTSYLQLNVPALRVNLDCSPMTNSTANLTLYIDPDANSELDGDFGEGCDSTPNMSRRWVLLPTNTHVGGYFGVYSGVGFKDNSACADSVLALGYLQDEHSTDQIHAYSCKTSINLF